MKKQKRRTLARVVMLAALFGTAACFKPATHFPAETTVSRIDFREHTRDGFLFSPNAYGGTFEAVGMVSVSMYPEVTWVAQTGKWVVTPLRLSDALTEARKAATALGADAIVNLSFQSLSKLYTHGPVAGIEVSGFAIKRAPR